LTIDAIDSIVEKTEGVSYEIIVVDNNSIDGSALELIKKFGNKIKLISNHKNIGFGRANNIAIKIAKGKYIFLLNSDTLLVNNAMKYFFDYMEKHTDNAICGGALYNLDMSQQISYGHFPSLKQVFFEEFQLSKLFVKYFNKNLSVGCVLDTNNIRIVDYVSGADMFIRKSIIQSIGGFDADFFLYYEETELNYRINKLGYKSVILPDAKIIHLCGKSFGNDVKLSKFKIQQNSKFLFFKKAYGIKHTKFLKVLLNFSYSIKFIASFNKKYIDWIRINNNLRW
jgi:GT2 family glycosyltransferase